MVDYVKKRDGRVVKFDRSKIENAVSAAFRDVGNGYTEDDIKKVVRAVLYKITQIYGDDNIPSVEEINDIVEIVLMKHGYYDVAKAFIMYRKKKEDERREKMHIWGLKKWVDDPVLKRFSINALRVLASRYPIKDDSGNIVEMPSEIFRRVAVGVAIAEMLYDKKVFDKNGGHKARYPNVFKGEELEELDVEIFDYKLNRYMWERLYERFKELADEGKMKVSWDQFVELVKEGKITKDAERYAEEWYEYMVGQYFMPNTPAIVNAGRPLYMLSACFVGKLQDSLEGIMKAATDMVMISRAGGGVGCDFTVLRPEGDRVSRTSGTSSGAVSFMKMFDAISDVIKQGGCVSADSFVVTDSGIVKLEKLINERTIREDVPIDINVFDGDEFVVPYVARVGKQKMRVFRTKHGYVLKVAGDDGIETGNGGVGAGRVNIGNFLTLRLNWWNFGIEEEGNDYYRLGVRVKDGEDIDWSIVFRASRGAVWDFLSGLFGGIRRGHKVRVSAEVESIVRMLGLGLGVILDKDEDGNLTVVNVFDDEVYYDEVVDIDEEYGYVVHLEIPKSHKYIVNGFIVHNVRRGANMGVMQYWHPEIDKFIHAKEKNDGNSILTTFNISVGLWEDFWKKLERGEEFELINPRNGSVWGKKDARKFFEELAHMAWAKADPGVLYFDRHNQYNIMREKWGDITATNPCLTGDVLVVTPEGLKRMDELKVGDMVYVGNGRFEKIEKFYDSGEQDVYCIVTRMGFEVKATGDHRFMTSRGVKRVDEMKVGDAVFVWMNWKEQEYGVGEFVPDVIVKIEYVGKEHVYDFETGGNKWFFANGIYNLDCGEEALYPYEACNLLSINLWKFVKKDENGNKYFDWDEYAKVIRSALRMLDDVIDVNKYPLPEINVVVKKTRRVGLGFMGVAEALFELGIPYNSRGAYDLMKKWAETNQYFAMVESVELAKERGKFLAFEESGYVKGELPVAGYYEVPKEEWNYDWDGLVEDIKKHGIRNAFLTTAPPTGSVSMIADTSSGIEPQFALAYKKSVTIGDFYYVDPVFERVLKERGIYSDDLIKKVVDNGGSVQGIEEVPEDIRRVFVTAMDIHWMDHILAQAAFQLWTDVSISKTINMPNNATVEDVKAAYLMGHYLGLKGVTIYRMGSLTYQVLSTENDKKREPRMSDYAEEVFEKILRENEWLKSYINLEEISGYESKEDGGGLFLSAGIEFPKKKDEISSGSILDDVSEIVKKYVESGKSVMDEDEYKVIDKELREKNLLGAVYCPMCWEMDRVLSPIVFEAGCKACKRCGWSACTVA